MNTSLRLVSVLSGLTVLSGLAGCGFLSSLFPDKQKQYQYSTEIPPLEIPPELSAATIQGARLSRKAGREAGLDDVTSVDKPFDGAVVAGLPPLSPEMARATRDAQNLEPETLERPVSGRYVLAESSDGTPLIEIGEPYPVAWNSVGRVLGRLKLKISDQNRSDGLYYVYPDEVAGSPDEPGVWSGLLGFITGKPVHGQEYRIRLEERGKMTYVMVVNDKNQPLTEGEGLELLKRLHEGLQKTPSIRSQEDEEQP